MPGSSAWEDLILRDTRANQPAAGINGRLYFVTDELVWERDNGSSWDDVSALIGLPEDADYSDISANDASTDVTGAELEELTDGSETELHSHAGSGSGGGISADGWVSLSATLTYSSADDPTYVISSDTDLTDVLSVGMKIWFQNNSTDFYGFIMAIGAWSGSVQIITLYGGTDYDVANSAISAPFYSTAKAPLGFPMNPSYWTVSVSNTSICAKSSPTANVWYGDTGLSPTGPSIVLPIGVWAAGYEAIVQDAKSGTCDMKSTFSTASNSESDSTMTDYSYSSNGAGIIQKLAKTKIFSVAAKTTYYLNLLTTQGSTTAIQTRGDISATKLFAICAYL